MNAPVVTALDHRYLGYLRVLSASLIKHSPEVTKLHVLYPSGDNQVMDAIDAAPHLVGHPVDPSSLSAFPIHGRGSVANYLRLAIPDRFPEASKVFYIDADCIVRHPLPDIEINKGILLAAVPNQERRQMHRLRIPREHGYFNSGVMLLALEAWREIDFAETLQHVAAERGAEFTLWDQDLLNIAVKGNWQRLPRIWNATAELYFSPAGSYHREAALDPIIAHFTGPGKPLDSNPRTTHPFYPEFLAYAGAPKTKVRDVLTKLALPATPKLAPPAKRLLSRAIRELSQLETLSGKTAHSRPTELERQTLASFETLTVQRGPFTGLLYPEAAASGSALLPKLLGTYESELSPVVQEIITFAPEQIIDVGCAEGYYAAGFARALPGTKVVAYDINPVARKRCSALSEANGLENLTVEEEFSLSLLPDVKSGLLFVDIEGAETDLFLETDIVPKDWHIIIELHDFVDPNTSTLLIEHFQESHEIELIATVPPAVKARMLGIPMSEALALVDEKRPCAMEWLYAKPRG